MLSQGVHDLLMTGVATLGFMGVAYYSVLFFKGPNGQEQKGSTPEQGS